jgi:hypothetical protein
LFLEVNVESIFVARVCLGLAGLTYAGQWGCALSEGTPHARCQVVWHAFRLGLAGLTRAGRWFSFDFGHRVPRGYEAGSLGLFLR